MKMVTERGSNSSILNKTSFDSTLLENYQLISNPFWGEECREGDGFIYVETLDEIHYLDSFQSSCKLSCGTKNSLSALWITCGETVIRNEAFLVLLSPSVTFYTIKHDILLDHPQRLVIRGGGNVCTPSLEILLDIPTVFSYIQEFVG